MNKWTWQNQHWPDFQVDYCAVAHQLTVTQQKVDALNLSVGWLPSSANEHLEIETLCLESVGTAAIEGIVIDPDAVRSSIAKKLGINSAAWKTPPRDVEGLVDILISASEKWEQPINKDTLCAWHGALFPTGRSGLERIVTGEYRKEDIRIISGGIMGKPDKVHYLAPPPEQVDSEMERFFDWFNRTAQEPSLVRAAVAHFWFEAIHPFEDGNGRLGRVILDVALAQNDRSSKRFFSISHQLSGQRGKYVDAMGSINRLEESQPLDITSWVTFFLDQVQVAVAQSQQKVEMAILKNKFWSNVSHLSLNERQRKVLNKILDAGPQGFEGGITNSKYISMGQTTRPTATRDLAELREWGVLVADGGGRSRSYRLDWQALMTTNPTKAKRLSL